MVDGQVVEEPQFMVSDQKIELHPEASLTPPEPATILLHQPVDTGMNAGMDVSAALKLIRAETRAADDSSGIRMLKQHFLRLTQHIPLERNASGMVIFTQDWRAARKLSDDAATLEQEYIVEVAGDLPSEGLKLLNHGLTFNGRALPPIKVSWQNENPAALRPQRYTTRTDSAHVQKRRATSAGDETHPHRASVHGQIAARAMAISDAA